MKKSLVLVSGALAVLALPMVSFAATPINDLTGVGNFIISFINNIVVPVLFAIAFIVFLWGAFQTFIIGATSEGVKENGKNLMLWGLIGFFVMVSVWGLVNILTGTISFSNNNGPSSVPSSGVHVNNP